MIAHQFPKADFLEIGPAEKLRVLHFCHVMNLTSDYLFAISIAIISSVLRLIAIALILHVIERMGVR